MPGGAASSAAAAAAEQEAAASPQGAPAEESAGEKPAAAVTAVPAQPTGPSPAEPGAKQAADYRPAAPPRYLRRNGASSTRLPEKRRKSDAGKNRTGRAYRMVGLLVIVVALAVGAGSFVALHHSGRSGHKALLPSAQIPLAIRNTAGAWVASQVAASDVVACDPVMCQALKAHGMAAGRLRVQWPGSDDLSGCCRRRGHACPAGPAWQPGLIPGTRRNHRQVRVRGPADRHPGGCSPWGRRLPFRPRQ